LHFGTLEDVPIILNPSTPLAFLGKPKKSEEYEHDASVHNRESDEWYDCDVDEEKCIVLIRPS